MVITQPTIDDFSDTTVMRVIRKIVNYICSDSGLVAQINDNDITGFTSSYKDNVLKIDATKGDGSKLPVCNVTIEGGGSSTGNPYPTAVSGTVGVDGNIKFTITMSSGSPLTTTINMNHFASTADLSDLQEQVTGIKPSVTTNLETSPPTITVTVNGTSSTANLPSGGSSTQVIEGTGTGTEFRNRLREHINKKLYCKGYLYSSNSAGTYSCLFGFDTKGLSQATTGTYYQPAYGRITEQNNKNPVYEFDIVNFAVGFGQNKAYSLTTATKAAWYIEIYE